MLDANEHLVYQLVELHSETDKGVPRTYCPTPKAHATLFSNKFQPLYLEHLNMLIGRAGRKVTKIYAHYTFEQERLKIDFILMNQNSRQIDNIDIEKSFCNCAFVPIFNEFNEVTYLKKYYSLYDQKVVKLVSSDPLKQDAEEKYNDAMQLLSKDKPFR